MKIKGKKVAIIGFGISSQGACNFLLKYGASIDFFDSRKSEEIDKDQLSEFSKKENVKFFLGDEYNTNDELEGYDFLLVSPSVDEDHPKVLSAKEKDIPIHLDITIFLELWNERGTVIGVTGSNGKSTIVSLLNEILNNCGKKAYLAGNIGNSPLDFIDEAKEGDVVILELSSYQLKFFRDNHFVDIAVITNISNNHLDKHGNSIREYAKAKFKIINKDHTSLIIDSDNDGIKKYIVPLLSHVDVFPVSLKTVCDEALEDGIYTNSNGDLVSKEDNEIKIVFPYDTERNILGIHNLYNIACIFGVLQKLNLNCDNALETIKNFKGLEHRIQRVAYIKGITFINDSKSTSVDATIKALDTIGDESGNIILILGGNNKGASYEVLENEVRENVKSIIYLPGIAEKEFKKVLGDIDSKSVSNMEEAVETAFKSAEAGDIVLLSPAAASDKKVFKSFEDRGEKFKEEVKKYE